MTSAFVMEALNRGLIMLISEYLMEFSCTIRQTRLLEGTSGHIYFMCIFIAGLPINPQTFAFEVFI